MNPQSKISTYQRQELDRELREKIFKKASIDIANLKVNLYSTCASLDALRQYRHARPDLKNHWALETSLLVEMNGLKRRILATTKLLDSCKYKPEDMDVDADDPEILELTTAFAKLSLNE